MSKAKIGDSMAKTDGNVDDVAKSNKMKRRLENKRTTKVTAKQETSVTNRCFRFVFRTG